MNAKNLVTSLSTIIVLSGAVVSTPALSAEDQSWDVYDGAGIYESIHHPPIHSSKATFANLSTGKGWDAFNNGQGEHIHVSQSVPSSGEGWDVFRTGLGDKF